MHLQNSKFENQNNDKLLRDEQTETNFDVSFDWNRLLNSKSVNYIRDDRIKHRLSNSDGPVERNNENKQLKLANKVLVSALLKSHVCSNCSRVFKPTKLNSIKNPHGLSNM